MSIVMTASLTLAADVRNVGAARRMVRDTMFDSGAEADLDSVVLAVSELVTNALVHTGAEVGLRVWSSPTGTRVEVEDSSVHVPVLRHYAQTAGTGRGVQLVEELSDRWGVELGGSGKVVWFEVGEPVGPTPPQGAGSAVSSDAGSGEAVRAQAAVHQVTLRRAPLLMHWAWQEHGAALLREYLLHELETDVDILDKHAESSAAMSLLMEQMPAPDISDDPAALMAGALEPDVSADEVVLQVPAAAVSQFATLDDMLRAATVAARDGSLLGPPTQPEIEEMRSWICSEVADQAGGRLTATPWLARTDVRATSVDQEHLAMTYAGLSNVDEPLLATDEASVIVAVSPAALDLLGYLDGAELIGRRIIAVVPARYHQAHIAGTTLNATNGRDVLLGVPLVVPMVRADSTEVMVSIEVRPERLADGLRVFVARFQEVAGS